MLKNSIIVLIFFTLLAWYGYDTFNDTTDKRNNWQTQISPGKLSAAHAQLSTQCAACHTAVKGIDDAKCISCHADNKALLERQPTAFHGIIGNCASCHIEHKGMDVNLRKMNHEALAQIGSKMIINGVNISNILDNSIQATNYPLVSGLEATLNCANCHSTKDKHIGLFGQNCASCHATSQWTIPKFQHPSVNSIVCSQCHQAPPSHYMMHFDMVDKLVAARSNVTGNGCCEGVKVNQCYSCHKTTSFNDIQGVGFYKHH